MGIEVRLVFAENFGVDAHGQHRAGFSMRWPYGGPVADDSPNAAQRLTDWRIGFASGNADVIRQELESEPASSSVFAMSSGASRAGGGLRAQARACVRFETPRVGSCRVDFGEARVWIGGGACRIDLFVATLAFSRRLHRRRKAGVVEGVDGGGRSLAKPVSADQFPS